VAAEPSSTFAMRLGVVQASLKAQRRAKAAFGEVLKLNPGGGGADGLSG
jgi:hypothetical protein